MLAALTLNLLMSVLQRGLTASPSRGTEVGGRKGRQTQGLGKGEGERGENHFTDYLEGLWGF